MCARLCKTSMCLIISDQIIIILSVMWMRDSTCCSDIFCHEQVLKFGHKQKRQLHLNALKPSKTYLTCIGCSRRGVGAVGTVCAKRGVETKVVWLCIIWHSARGAAVVLVRAELAKWRPCAMARLLAVVIAAVRRRGHWESRGLLRFVQAVVVAWGNLVRMHISI